MKNRKRKEMSKMAKQDELSSLDTNIQAQTERLKKLKEKKKRLLEADNIKLGKLVRQIFGKELPDSVDERKVFFQQLKELSDRQQHAVTQQPSNPSDYQAQVAQTVHTSQVSQDTFGNGQGGQPMPRPQTYQSQERK